MAEFYRDSFVLFIVKVNKIGLKTYAVPDPLINLNIIEILKPVYKATGFEKYEVAS